MGFIPLIQKQSLTMTHAAPLNMLTVVVKVSLQLLKVAQAIIMQVLNPVVMLKLFQLSHLQLRKRFFIPLDIPKDIT